MSRADVYSLAESRKMAIGYDYMRWISFFARPHDFGKGNRVNRRNLYTLLILLCILPVVMKRFRYGGMAFFDFRGHLL